jgi:hypothetical protein
MRKIVLALALLAVTVSGALCTHAQAKASASPDPDLTGTWTGYGIQGNGSRIDLVLELTHNGDAYTGILRTAGGSATPMPLRNVKLADGSLTFDLDFPGARGPELIRVRLRYQDGALTGSYTDSTGDSDRMHFERGT